MLSGTTWVKRQGDSDLFPILFYFIFYFFFPFFLSIPRFDFPFSLFLYFLLDLSYFAYFLKVWGNNTDN